MNTKRGLLFFIAVLLITLSACGSQNEVVKETEETVEVTSVEEMVDCRRSKTA